MATGKRLSPCAAATTASGSDSSENIQNVQGADALVGDSKDPLNKSREPARHGTGCRTRRHLLSIAALLTANGNAVMRPLRGCDGRGDLFRGSLKLSELSWRDCCLYCCALGGYAFLSIG